MISLKMSLIAALYSLAFINSVNGLEYLGFDPSTGRSNGIGRGVGRPYGIHWPNILEPESTDSSSKHKDSDYYRAEKCTDGDRSYDRVCQTREENDTNPWIQLDFGSKVDIYAVKLHLFNRDGESQKLQCQDDDCTEGFEIRVGNSKCDKVNDDCDRNSVCYASGNRRTSGKSSITIEIEDCKRGRYLQVRLPGSGRVLKLREIEVSGDYTCDRYDGISRESDPEVCCKKSCGTCGGSECSKNGDANDCCVGLIREEENYCMDSSDDAPCQLARKFDEYEKHDKHVCRGDGHVKVKQGTAVERTCRSQCTENPNCSGYEYTKETTKKYYVVWVTKEEDYDCYHWIRPSWQSPLIRGDYVITGVYSVKRWSNNRLYKDRHECNIKIVEEDFWSFDDDRRRRLQQMEENEILETGLDA